MTNDSFSMSSRFVDQTLQEAMLTTSTLHMAALSIIYSCVSTSADAAGAWLGGVDCFSDESFIGSSYRSQSTLAQLIRFKTHSLGL